MVHTPIPWPLSKLQRIPTDKKVLKNNTIHVRLAGVDAPEVCGYERNISEMSPYAHCVRLPSSHTSGSQLSHIRQKLWLS